MDLQHPLLGRQAGVYAVRQAPALGLTRTTGGRWPGTRLHTGVYSLLPGPPTARARWVAALLHAGPASALTGPTAAAARGWRTTVAREASYVVVPHTRRRQSVSDVIVSRSRLIGVEVCAGLPVATAPLTLAACATVLDQRELLAVVARALQRREAAAADTAAFCAQHPRLPGTGRLAGALRHLAGGAESVAELDCLQLFRRWGLPAPRCQVEVYDARGRLLAVADFWWAGVAVFYDGGMHLDEHRRRRDLANRTALEAAGVQVVVVAAGLGLDLLRDRLAEAFRAAAVSPGTGWVASAA